MGANCSVDSSADQAGRDWPYLYLRIGRKRSNDILGARRDPDIRREGSLEDDVRKISRVLEEVGGVEGDLARRSPIEHQAADGDRLLPRPAAPRNCRRAASGRAPTRAREGARARADCKEKDRLTDSVGAGLQTRP